MYVSQNQKYNRMILFMCNIDLCHTIMSFIV